MMFRTLPFKDVKDAQDNIAKSIRNEVYILKDEYVAIPKDTRILHIPSIEDRTALLWELRMITVNIPNLVVVYNHREILYKYPSLDEKCSVTMYIHHIDDGYQLSIDSSNYPIQLNMNHIKMELFSSKDDLLSFCSKYQQ